MIQNYVVYLNVIKNITYEKGFDILLGNCYWVCINNCSTFVIGITNSNANESDITIAEQQTVFTTATKFEVFQVLGDGALANCEEKGYSTSFFTGPVVYIVTDGQNLFYDDQVIEVPKGKKAMQIGTFRYETKLGEKVVPVIKFQ